MILPPPGVPIHHAPPRLSRTDPSAARIVVPFTTVHPDTRAALEPYAGQVEYVDVSRLGAYWELFAALWRDGDDFVIIEHDIVVNPDTIDSFDGCDAGWCSAPYWWRGRPGRPWERHEPSFRRDSPGCCRFRSEFIKATPELGDVELTAIRRRLPNLLPPLPLQHWYVDFVVGGRMLEKGLSPHLHAEVQHHQRDIGQPLPWQHKAAAPSRAGTGIGSAVRTTIHR